MRTLRWVGASQTRRCEAAVTKVLSAWFRDWAGFPVEVGVAACAPQAVSNATADILQLGSDPNWSLTIADLAPAFLAALEGSSVDARPPATPLARELCRRATGDLLQQLMRELWNPQMAPDEACVASAWPAPQPAFSGDLLLSCEIASHGFFLHVGGELVARLLPSQPAATGRLPAISSSTLAHLAADTRLGNEVCVGNSSITLDALLGLEVGDVVVLDQSVHKPIAWDLPGIELQLQAFLVQSNARRALELVSPHEAIRP
jgi:hypothetical protein